MNLKKINNLEKKLYYKFKNINLLKTSITHCSYSKDNNQKLEFLGDSILNIFVSTFLFYNFPNKNEGYLSRIRAYLVSKKVLFDIAINLNIEQYIFLGQGEKNKLLHEKESILADSVEAIIAAIYIDHNNSLEKCKNIFFLWFNKYFEEIKNNNLQKDYKTQLQELTQSSYYSLPYYLSLLKEKKNFLSICYVKKINKITMAYAKSKKLSEQISAKKMIKHFFK